MPLLSYGKYMTTSELYDKIAQVPPEIIYISGKTSTGKSTFARQLHDKLGYDTVGLEEVLLGVCKANHLNENATFHKVFYEDAPCEEKELYLATTDEIIKRHLQSSNRLVIEGAVSNTGMLGRVLRPAGSLPVAYFHPEDLGPYIRNLTNRFMQANKVSRGGLPSKFWQHIDENEFKTFCKNRQLTEGLENSIRHYARESQQASFARLRKLQQLFSDITVVSID